MADPSTGQRLGFWLLLGGTSTAFAEVLFPTTAFDLPTMLLFAVPIYLLHTVVLAAVIYRARRVRYATLYLGGVVLGLYEAYVTKMLWAPLGDRPTFEIAGVFVFETVGLVFVWHPLVSFFLPVVVVEALATASNRSLRPPIAGYRFARPLVIGGVLSLLLFQAGLGGPWRALVGNAVALSVLLTGLFAWRHIGGNRYAMRDLLPAGRTLRALVVALVLVSVGLGAVIRPGELPRAPAAHLVILGLYLLAGGSLAVLLRGQGSAAAGRSIDVRWRRILTVAVAIVVATPILGLLGSPFRTGIFVSGFLIAVTVGIASVVAVILAFRAHVKGG
jgi:hypothetical protein